MIKTHVKIAPPKFKSLTEAKWWLKEKIRFQEGQSLWFEHEPVSLRIGAGARYTPDFIIVDTTGQIIAREIKGGFIREAALVRFKSARKQYPWIRFEMWQYKKKEWRQVHCST